MSQAGNLYWDATYEIVLSLIDAHPDADLDAMGLQQLFQLIVALPGFADDLELANDGILTEILREWYEEINPYA
jgi:FeS assembly protein IscX